MPDNKAVKLTVKLVRELSDRSRASGKRERLWDTEVRGFGVRAFPTGRVSFLLRYTLPSGDRADRTIDVPSHQFDVSAARTAAEKLRGAIAGGEMPVKRGSSRPQTGPVTVQVLIDAYISRCKNKNLTKEVTYAEYERLLNRSTDPSLRRTRAAEVTWNDIEALHNRLADRPVLANRVVQLLGACYRYAWKPKLVEPGFNPCAGVEMIAVEPRSKSLQPPEYARLGQALDIAERIGLPTAPALAKKGRGMARNRKKAITGVRRGPYELASASADRRRADPANPVDVAFIRFLALTGWRRSEAARLQWSQLRIADRAAVLPTKKKSLSTRPLGDPALAIIEEMKSFRVGTNDDAYVFFPGVASKQRRENRRLWANAVHHADLKVRLHDLRHSFKTMANRCNITDEETKAALLDHSPRTMTQYYGEVPTEHLARAADTVSRAVAKAMGFDFGAKNPTRHRFV